MECCSGVSDWQGGTHAHTHENVCVTALNMFLGIRILIGLGADNLLWRSSLCG